MVNSPQSRRACASTIGNLFSYGSLAERNESLFYHDTRRKYYPTTRHNTCPGVPVTGHTVETSFPAPRGASVPGGSNLENDISYNPMARAVERQLGLQRLRPRWPGTAARRDRSPGAARLPEGAGRSRQTSGSVQTDAQRSGWTRL